MPSVIFVRHHPKERKYRFNRSINRTNQTETSPPAKTTASPSIEPSKTNPGQSQHQSIHPSIPIPSQPHQERSSFVFAHALMAIQQLRPQPAPPRRLCPRPAWHKETRQPGSEASEVTETGRGAGSLKILSLP